MPSAIFPAIIFPPIFLDNAGSLDFESNPKILAAVIAIIIGFLVEVLLLQYLQDLFLIGF